MAQFKKMFREMALESKNQVISGQSNKDSKDNGDIECKFCKNNGQAGNYLKPQQITPYIGDQKCADCGDPIDKSMVG